MGSELPANGHAPLRRASRLPTVDEALPYSPFTSIIPFNSGIIPIPTISPHSFIPSLLSEAEAAHGRASLRNLDAQLLDPSQTVSAPLKTAHDLSKLLEQSDLTFYKFKSLTSRIRQETQPSNGTHKPSEYNSHLGPFANMFLETAQLGTHKHSIPVSLSPTFPSTKSTADPRVDAQSSKRAGLFVTSGSQQAHSMQANVNITPQRSPINTGTPRSQPTVLIERLFPSSHPERYEQHPQVDAAVLTGTQDLSKKRKRESDPAEIPYAQLGLDEQDRTSAALTHLLGLMHEIFEAEDQLQLSTSDVVGTYTQHFFVASVCGDGNSMLLVPDLQRRLETSMTKVVSSGCFDDVPIEELARCQKLCSKVVDSSLSNEITMDDGMNEVLLDQCSAQVELFSSSLLASKIMLRIMIAGKEERQLYSEESVQDLLNNVKQGLEAFVVPVVEAKFDSTLTSLINGQTEIKTVLTIVLQRLTTVLRLLGDLLLVVSFSDTSVNTVESVAASLVFVENATNEKDSLLGIQKFETVRRSAMDVISKIFLRCSDQRRFIFDDILSSIEKLPVSRQSARQFKIAEGKPVQLVSALILQLVQTSTTKSNEMSTNILPGSNEVTSDESDSSASEESPSKRRKRPKTIGNSQSKHATLTFSDNVIQSLTNVVQPLLDTALSNAAYVSKFLISRALKSTKTGEQPYRNLLDIFTEDFISLLSNPDWPAAELLLRTLLSHLIHISENDKSAAPAKNMALDLMGSMGSGMADVQAYIQHSCHTFEASESKQEQDLCRMAGEFLQEQIVTPTLLGRMGSYYEVHRCLAQRVPNEPQLKSAQDYFMATWARSLSMAVESSSKDLDESSRPKDLEQYRETATWLTKLLLGSSSIEWHDEDEKPAASHGRLFYALCVLNTPFCKSYRRLFHILLTSLSSTHATVRSRALKSVIQLLDKDHSILDRQSNAMAQILKSASDSSPMVRDSALGLVGKCLTLKPSLETEVYQDLINMTLDPAIGVRKRIIRLLKEIYVRTKSADIKASIAETILKQTNAAEESIAELSRQIMEEVWLTPFHGHASNENPSVQEKQDLQNHCNHVTSTVRLGEIPAAVFDELFGKLLCGSSRNAIANQQVCKSLIRLMFDKIIDNNTQITIGPDRQSFLHTLTIFAKARPSLFTLEHMMTLRPYIENLCDADDPRVYRSVLVIYRHVLPVLPQLQQEFLAGVQSILLRGIQRLGKLELNEAAECLWIIDRALGNPERLIRVMTSVLTNIYKMRSSDFTQENLLRKVSRLLMLAGHLGKACDFEDQKNEFQAGFPSLNVESVSGLLVDIINPLADPTQPLSLREVALESLLLICQSRPRCYLKTHLLTNIEAVFYNDNKRLELVVLLGIRRFYTLEEERSKLGPELPVGDGVNGGAERLGKSMIHSDNDGASTSIARQFLDRILHIALRSTDELARIATEIIVSINRQGLIHPKECGAALVALETCPNKEIAALAFKEHSDLHHKHESMLEKEYVKAIRDAFNYQKDTIHDSSGANEDMTPKLIMFFQVLRSGGVALRKKLHYNLSKTMDIEFSKIQSPSDLENHLLYVRFVCQNLALIEYARVDEILHLIGCFEKVFSTTGSVVSQHFETWLANQATEIPSDQPIDDNLRCLTLCGMVLCAMWDSRTYLKRVWSLQNVTSSKSQRPATKDMSKAPTRASNVSPEAYLRPMDAVGALSDRKSMITQCKAFIELLNTDMEAKVVDSDENERVGTPMEHDPDDGSLPPSAGGKAGRKRGSVSTNGTPSQNGKKRGRPPLAGKRLSSTKVAYNPMANDDKWE